MKFADLGGDIGFHRLVDIGKDLKRHQILDDLERSQSEVVGKLLDNDRRLEVENFFTSLGIRGFLRLRNRLWI